MKYRTYLILGPPGSGKATLAHSLGTIPRFYHMASTEVFGSLETRTALGRSFLEHASRGEPVPDDVAVQLWMARIDAEVAAHAFKPDIDALVLDALPRNVSQARLMDEHLEVEMIFSLEVPDRGVLSTRVRDRALHENRFEDANEAAIQNRLNSFQDESALLLAHYSPELIRRIEATQSAAVVLRQVLAEIVAFEEGAGLHESDEDRAPASLAFA
ncbi:MAG: nucleoside monophosphate kinase [Verrucomicrobiota bacterium]|nr:nucleoside monophosphate kinase [Chthoniobacterales bacterium]MDQ3415056.1 nucleoside monophosphate kinase [Verrucomicrobiota bacterium]